VARTRENDLILDNLNENIRPITEISYQWARGQLPKLPSAVWSYGPPMYAPGFCQDIIEVQLTASIEQAKQLQDQLRVALSGKSVESAAVRAG
jgi:hypothetical protein